MKVLPFLLFFLAFNNWVLSQDGSAAQVFINKANEAIEAGDLPKADLLLLQATEIYDNTNNWPAYFDCAVTRVENHIQMGEYEKGIQAASNYIEEANRVNYKAISISLLHKNIGKIHYIQDNYKAAFPQLEQAALIRENINPNDPDLARDYYNLGVISRYAERYNRAIEFLDEAVKLQEDENVLARIYTELGSNYKLIGNFRKSLDYQEQAIRILEKEKDDSAMAIALLEKGATLTELKQSGNDLIYLKQALVLFQSPQLLDYTNQVNCCQQIAYAFFKAPETNELQNNLDSAQFYYRKALAIAKKHLPKDNPYSIQVLFNLSSVLADQGKMEQAELLLEQAEAKSSNIYAPKSLEAVASLATRATFYRLQGKYAEALQYEQQQLISLIKNYNQKDIWDLPTLQQATNSLSYDMITDVLASKARCWYLYYKYGTKEVKKLEAALQTIRLFDQVVNRIRADFSNSGSNIAWSDLTLDAYENAIETCIALAKATGDLNYHQQALYFSEKSKGLSLLESFQNTKAQQVSGLSEKDLIKEREMKLDIIDLEQKVFQLTQEENPNLQETIKKLKKQIFLKRETYQDFLKNLEINNPQYYQTKYQLNILNLEQIRSLLKENQALIEYFVGDSSIYAFKITQTTFELIPLDGQESMLDRVGDLRESIYGYFLSNKERDRQMHSKFAKQYAERAYQMYQKLIEPLGPLPKRLLIVPAGPMCDMPFEPLLTEKVNTPNQYKSHPFLLRKHSISYCYSATLLQEMMNKIHLETEHTYAGFAPSFGKHATSVIRGKRYSLSPLTFNQPEVEKISALLGTGTVFKDRDATEEQFKQIASNYKIIHFATHGMANSDNPDYSLLAFTEIKDEQENEFLYVSDLYNLELNAEMVVLSACETALGKNFRGEGIMSLARGFSYAGAKSIFTTLWSVNDQSTYAIINGYYHFLQKGMDKDEALSLSKLHYIDHANNVMAHPFLWSPYILIGDTTPIAAITKTPNWVLISGGSVLLLLLLGLGNYFFKKKQ